MRSIKNYSSDKKESIEDTYSKYSSLNQDELFGQLKTVIEARRGDGTYNKEEILANINSLTPFLDAEKVEKMKQLISSL